MNNDLFKKRIEAYDFDAMSYVDLRSLLLFIKAYMYTKNGHPKQDDLLFIAKRIESVAFARIDKQFFQIPIEEDQPTPLCKKCFKEWKAEFTPSVKHHKKAPTPLGNKGS